MVLRIAHANFARGYRGGERQTEILIRELSKRDDVEQTLFTGHSSELAARLAGTKGLRIAETSRLGGHLRGGFDVLQAQGGALGISRASCPRRALRHHPPRAGENQGELLQPQGLPQ